MSSFVPSVLIILLGILEGSPGWGSGISPQTFAPLPPEVDRHSQNSDYEHSTSQCHPDYSSQSQGSRALVSCGTEAICGGGGAGGGGAGGGGAGGALGGFLGGGGDGEVGPRDGLPVYLVMILEGQVHSAEVRTLVLPPQVRDLEGAVTPVLCPVQGEPVLEILMDVRRGRVVDESPMELFPSPGYTHAENTG